MTSVDVDPGPDFAPGPPRALFPLGDLELANWGVGPRGRGFLFVRPRAPDSYTFVLVENLSEELKRRVGN